MKVAIIDTGGGLCDIFGAGVLDYCLNNSINFDLCIGVSAGSANLSSFVAGQLGRNYRFYKIYSARKEYMSFSNLQVKGNYADFDYAYGTLSNEGGEDALDYAYFCKNPTDYYAVVTNALTGEAEYLRKQEMKKNAYHPIKASSSFPPMNNPYVINGTPYYDGVISDFIPIDLAFNLGCDKAVVIFSQPITTFDFSTDKKIASKIGEKYPQTAKTLLERKEKITNKLIKLQEYEKQGKALILEPTKGYGVQSFTRNEEGMQKLYEEGLVLGENIKKFLQR